MGARGWDGVHEAAGNRTSGAAEIVRRAAEALAALPSNDVEAAVVTLVRGQPSMAPLWNLGTEVLGSDNYARTARDFAIHVAAESEEIARQAGHLLTDSVVVHSYSSTVIAAVTASGARAICARSEPGGEGATMAARLADMGVDARLVDDEEALVSVATSAAVVVGADAVGPGGVVNKIGTGALAVEARRQATPCYCLAGESKLLAVDLPAREPFERTATDLFTLVITPMGPLPPEEVARRVGHHIVHPVLIDILEKPN
jgi:translation initiation factor 2B subunit (eIF-2B alpha/beta/delta family)